MEDDPNVLRADIAERRERMSSTLEEIGERLNPQVIKENVKDSIREATIGRMSSMARTAADTVSRTTRGAAGAVRENPVPFALMAAGIGWLIWNNRASAREARRFDGGVDDQTLDDYDAAYAGFDAGSGQFTATDRSLDPYDSYGATIGSESQGFADRAGGRGTRVKERARDLSQAAQQRAGQLADRARGAATSVKQRTRRMAGSVADTTRRQAVRVEDAFQENPLALGAVAMAVGLAAGLAAPVTQREIRLMGDARDDFVDRVKELADDTREKAERVVSRVADDARQVAREEGLTGPA